MQMPKTTSALQPRLLFIVFWDKSNVFQGGLFRAFGSHWFCDVLTAPSFSRMEPTPEALAEKVAFLFWYLVLSLSIMLAKAIRDRSNKPNLGLRACTFSSVCFG